MKAAIYCRLSEEDENKTTPLEESESIQNQKSMLLQFAAAKGWEIYQIYSDDNYTGADRNRPAFQRLLRDAAEKKFDIILCKTQSRFTRELELVEKYLHGLFPLWNIRFVSVVDHVDTGDNSNKKARQINGLINEWYLEDMSENIKSVLNHRREKGLHIGAFAVYGYQKDPLQKGHLLIDSEAAPVVRQIFTLFTQGYGKTAIARRLNEQGVPSPAAYKSLQSGLPSPEPPPLWQYSTISRLLKNEMYLGNMVQGRYGSISYKTKQNKPRPQSDWYVVKNTHTPIIPQPLWEQAAALQKERAKPFAGGQRGLFAGKVRCSHCGHALRSTKNHNRHYLQCPTRYIKKEACPGVFVSVSSLENSVFEQFCALFLRYFDPQKAEAALLRQSRLSPPLISAKTEGDLCEKKLQQLSAALHRLYLDYEQTALSEEIHLSILKELHSQIQYWEGRKASFQKETVRKKTPLSPLPFNMPQSLSPLLVNLFIRNIIVEETAQNPKQLSVKIHWNI